MKKTALVLLLALPCFAWGHSMWLQPMDHTIDPGDVLVTDFRVGDSKEHAAWGLYWERVGSLRLHGDGTLQDWQGMLRETKGETSGGAQAKVAQPGTYVLAFESNSSFSDLEPERFNSYAEEEGLAAVLRDRASKGTTGAHGTELYSRRSKALVQVGDVTTNNVTRPLGHTLEIVPLQNPYALGVERKLTVQVLFRGKPLSEGTLHVSRLGGDGETVKLPTSEDGKVTLDIREEGTWLVDCVWAVPAPNDARADYVTVFASLTFES